jgi:hypothetical protein
MALNTNALQKSIISAIENEVGNQSQTALALAASQVAALAKTAKYIEDNKDNVSPETLDFMIKNHEDAVYGVLKGFEGISQTIAQQAANAALNLFISGINAAKILPFTLASI